MLFRLKLLLTIFILLTSFVGCNGGKMPEKTVQFPNIKDVPASKWENLSQKKIYFGHQSVGNNILAGIEDLMKENPKLKLNIVKTSEQANFNVSIFAHSAIGKNEDPQSKINEFVSFMANGIGGKADIASLKFCFVDVYSTTNIQKLFTEYKKNMSQLKEEYPETTLVHFTVPLLRKTKPTLKTWVKNILGKKDAFFDNAHNIARNNFNELLRKEYNGNEPLFDIAQVESTYTDGTRETFSQDGKTYYSMVPEYTDDGGHLNELGRKKVAVQLLIILANLS